MTEEQQRNTVLDLAYLAACSVNGQRPDPARVGRMDLEALYKAAEKHLLSGIAAMALESAGVHDEAFNQAKGKAIRKAALFDIERASVLSRLEESGIWYMPLKGCVLQAYYPKLGMRQMADNDILYDASRREDVRKIMEELGFKTALYVLDGYSPDVYNKAPVCSFEMHPSLFTPKEDEAIFRYFLGIRDKLIKDKDNAFGYHLSPEHCYIYLIVHEYKHYSTGGTGLRSLLDTYVYCVKEGPTLDWAYISAEMGKMGLADFEAKNRRLAMALFSGEPLTKEQQEMLDYLAISGVFGTRAVRVSNTVGKYGGGFLAKLRYVFRRIFLPMETIRSSYPLFIRCPILFPFLPLYRLIRALTVSRAKVRSEIRALVKYRREPTEPSSSEEPPASD